MNVAELADKFNDSFNAADEAVYRAILAKDAKIWHSFDNQDMSVDESWQAGADMRSVFDARIEALRVEELNDGYVQEHVMHLAHKKSGKKADIYACLIVTVAGDHITRIKEYIDTGGVAKLMG